MPFYSVKLLDCNSYEDYIDTFITTKDIRYLNNIHTARQIVHLGYRSLAKVLTNSEFRTEREIEQEEVWSNKKPFKIFSIRLTLNDAVLKELAARELPNHQKTISTIVFLTYSDKNGFEKSGFIDLEQHLRKANNISIGHSCHDCVDWRGVFQGTVKLLPQRTDLSFYDRHMDEISYNETDNFAINHDYDNGLMFMHKGDRKMFYADVTKKEFRKNVNIFGVYSDNYGDVLFYDHIIHKKI